MAVATLAVARDIFSRWRRTRVERGIYLLPNGKYAVCCRRGGRQWYRTIGSDLVLARAALIAAAESGGLRIPAETIRSLGPRRDSANRAARCSRR